MKILQNVLNKIKRYNLQQLIIGGLQMNTYKIPDSITKKVQSIQTKEKQKDILDEIYSKLDNVSNKFSGSNLNSVPEKIELEKMEFTRPSDEQIKKESEQALSEYKNNEIENINNDYKQKQDSLINNKESLVNTTNEAKEQLNNYYTQAIENSENQALKRGLSRSSIVINQLDAFEKDKIADYKALDEKLSSDINAINFELNALTGQKDNALKNFDITYAVKLQEKINSLTEELNKKEQEVIEYNNEIALKEAEYNKKVDELKNELENTNWENSVDLINLYGKYGAYVVEKVKNDEIYNTAKNLLSNLSEDQILAVLNDEGFKKRLGDNYEKLVSEFK